MNICFSPTNSNTNKYTKVIIDLLAAEGIQTFPLHSIFINYLLYSSIQIVHLNWFESLYKQSLPDKIGEFLRKICILFFLKITGKKIVWTMHNRLPHESSVLHLEKNLIYLLIRFSTRIIIHSKQSEQILLKYLDSSNNKIQYLPHPDYINVYKNSISVNAKSKIEGRTKEKLVDGQILKLLFLGAVRPYKNIELLMDVIIKYGNEVKLNIAGRPADDEYRKHLIRYASNRPNINLKLDFIPDDEITNYIEECDLLVLPYDKTSSLNSGTIILAFSNRKSVISPMIGTIEDLADMQYLYTYDYSSPEEHFRNLERRISEAIECKKSNVNVFEEWGKEMFAYVEKNNDKELMVKELVKTYTKLID